MRRLPLLALVLLALLPAAAAQVPAQPQACGPVTMEAPTSPASPLAPGAQGEVAVTVSNGGNTAVQVEVNANGEAAGWTVQPSGEETQSIPSGGSAPFTYVVAPSAGAAADLTLTLTVVSATCALPAPGVPCPPGACGAALPPPTSVVVRLQQPGGIGLPGLDGLGFPLEYLVAGVVLVGVASAIPFLLRRKGGGFVADCPEPLKMVRPGRGTSFPIEIRNSSNDPVTAQFDIGPVPEGWTAFMPLPEVQLAAKEARSLWLMVRSPSGAQPGEAADVEVRLRNPSRPDAGSSVRVRAEVNPAAVDAPARA